MFAVAKALRAQTFVLRADLPEAEAECKDALTASAAWGATARFSVLLAAFLADALIEHGVRPLACLGPG